MTSTLSGIGNQQQRRGQQPLDRTGMTTGSSHHDAGSSNSREAREQVGSEGAERRDALLPIMPVMPTGMGIVAPVEIRFADAVPVVAASTSGSDGGQGGSDTQAPASASASAGASGTSSLSSRASWSEEEDALLMDLIQKHGTSRWSAVASELGTKNNKQCRRRWQALQASVFGGSRGGWSSSEDATLLAAHRRLGNRWTEIAALLPGRTDNAAKNRFAALASSDAQRPPSRSRSDACLLASAEAATQAAAQASGRQSGSAGGGGGGGGGGAALRLRVGPNSAGGGRRKDCAVEHENRRAVIRSADTLSMSLADMVPSGGGSGSAATTPRPVHSQSLPAIPLTGSMAAGGALAGRAQQAAAAAVAAAVAAQRRVGASSGAQGVVMFPESMAGRAAAKVEESSIVMGVPAGMRIGMGVGAGMGMGMGMGMGIQGMEACFSPGGRPWSLTPPAVAAEGRLGGKRMSPDSGQAASRQAGREEGEGEGEGPVREVRMKLSLELQLSSDTQMQALAGMLSGGGASSGDGSSSGRGERGGRRDGLGTMAVPSAARGEYEGEGEREGRGVGEGGGVEPGDSNSVHGGNGFCQLNASAAVGGEGLQWSGTFLVPPAGQPWVEPNSGLVTEAEWERRQQARDRMMWSGAAGGAAVMRDMRSSAAEGEHGSKAGPAAAGNGVTGVDGGGDGVGNSNSGSRSGGHYHHLHQQQQHHHYHSNAAPMVPDNSASGICLDLNLNLQPSTE